MIKLSHAIILPVRCEWQNYSRSPEIATGDHFIDFHDEFLH